MWQLLSDASQTLQTLTPTSMCCDVPCVCIRAQGIEKAIGLLNCVTGDSLRETKQGRELLELVEEAERALDVEGRTTFRH